MRGRSLARRLRGSDIATLCVALPERTGRARVSSKTLGRHDGTRRRKVWRKNRSAQA